jgi:hypothetical protein
MEHQQSDNQHNHFVSVQEILDYHLKQILPENIKRIIDMDHLSLFEMTDDYEQHFAIPYAIEVLFKKGIGIRNFLQKGYNFIRDKNREMFMEMFILMCERNQSNKESINILHEIFGQEAEKVVYNDYHECGVLTDVISGTSLSVWLEAYLVESEVR